ncbi:MAG: MotA/TolQ/ExbB proton channel family protein, partial [Cyclobacteriaceae bacterium]|nr:MotA/TolQ/ExbB proton channel family protein [Cyclobacteriaceae bacterium]
MLLFQITELSPAEETITGGGEATVSVMDLIMQGGFMMIPIAILSIIAIYIFVERVLTIKKADQTPPDFIESIKNRVLGGDINGAKLLCVQNNTPIAKMIEKGISRIGSPLKTIEVSIENVGKIEIFKLEKNLSLLATISGSAPMLGFLGTVIGMIQSFISIAQEEGSVSPKLLSEGIYTAMVTTAAGLFVGILAYIGYNYLVSRVQKVVHRMEYTSID